MTITAKFKDLFATNKWKNVYHGQGFEHIYLFNY